MKKTISKLYKLLGFKIIQFKKKSVDIDIKKTLKCDYGEEAFEQIKIIRPYSMMPYTNLLTLYEQVVFIEKTLLEGDFVECGVWKGGSVGLMALANLKHSTTRRKIHLFDVYDNGSEPDPDVDGKFAIKQIKKLVGKKDLEVKGRLRPVEGAYECFGGKGTLEGNQYLLEGIIGYDKNKINYHKGWFQDTVPKDAHEIKKIAILRLDGDFYNNTKVCLEYLYDNVVSNGLIIIDDYGTYDGCKKAVDEFRMKNNIDSFLHYSNPDCRYWFKNSM